MGKARRAGRNRKTPVTVADSPWDHGATGPANRLNLVIEDRGEIDPETGKIVNPNSVKGARRVDLLAFWHRRGTITTAGFNAGEKLRNAYEATMKGTPALPDNDRVQSSPKPDQAVTIQIDRISHFDSLMRHVAKDDRRVIWECVLQGKHPGRLYGSLSAKYGLQMVRDALDRVALSLERGAKTR